MAVSKSRAKGPPVKCFAFRLVAKVAPAGKPRRVYLVCDANGPVASFVGGTTGETAIEAAGFANCDVMWELEVTYRMIQSALALLPGMAGKRRRVK